jgi:putative phosphoesterase
MVKIGVVSDTHGYFHPHLPAVFKDVYLILHAGDVGRMEVIRQLERIAPVQAVRGNMDGGLRPPRFPLRRLVQVEQVTILMTHLGIWSEELETWLREEHGLEHADVFVYGHSHRAGQRWEGKTLYFNPGAAGQSRRGGGPSVGILSVRDTEVMGHIVPLRLP